MTKKKELGEPFVLEGHSMTKAFGDLRFRFAPCGYKPPDLDNMIYVHYKPTSKHSFDQPLSIVGADSGYVHFDFPDREIMISKHAYTIDGDRPFNKPRHGKQWHQAVVMSVANVCGDDLPFDRFMINPHAYTENNEPRIRDKKTLSDSDKVIISDSGGFQLGHGAVSFIHPAELCGFYKRNVDEGIVLDLPARSLGDTEILKYTAKVQNLNTKYMKKLLPKDFRWATVAHGLSLDNVAKYRQDIENFDSDFDILCISGALRHNMIESLHRILHIITTGARYKQYHILGVSNPPFFATLIYMAYVLKKKGIHVMVTSDSSSPIAFGLKYTYYQQRVFYDGLIPTRFGGKMNSNADTPAGAVPNVHRKFASSDPISHILGGYQDAMSLYYTSFTQAYITYLNQIELVRYINQMCLYADELSHTEYKKMVKEQYKASNHSHTLSVSLDYLHVFHEYDLKTAFSKFKYYMPAHSGEHAIHKFPSMIQTEEEVEEQHSFAVKKKHLVKVLKNYFDFHKTGKVPDVARNVIKHGGSNLTLRL